MSFAFLNEPPRRMVHADRIIQANVNPLLSRDDVFPSSFRSPDELRDSSSNVDDDDALIPVDLHIRAATLRYFPLDRERSARTERKRVDAILFYFILNPRRFRAIARRYFASDRN